MMPLSAPASEAVDPSMTAPSVSMTAPSGVDDASGTVTTTGVVLTVELHAAVTTREMPTKRRFIESSLLHPADAPPRRSFRVDRHGEIDFCLPRRSIHGEIFHASRHDLLVRRGG